MKGQCIGQTSCYRDYIRMFVGPDQTLSLEPKCEEFLVLEQED